jgi:hypothetical protein
MEELDDAISRMRLAIRKLRPTFRPYVNGAVLLVILLSAGFDIYRYEIGHPRPLWAAATNYVPALAYLLFDFVFDRKLRKRQQETEGLDTES